VKKTFAGVAREDMTFMEAVEALDLPKQEESKKRQTTRKKEIKY